MQLIFLSLPKPLSHSQSQLLCHGRTFVDDAATIKWIRDHGLDRVVEKEKNLTFLYFFTAKAPGVRQLVCQDKGT
jgi:hypothetical protein